MIKNKPVYADVDLTFKRNPVTGDVRVIKNDEAVIQSVINLVLTNFYERPHQPNVGSNVDAHLFENANALTASSIESDIRNVIKNFEPRCTIDYVDVVVIDEVYYVTICVYIGNNTSSTTVTLTLERSR